MVNQIKTAAVGAAALLLAASPAFGFLNGGGNFNLAVVKDNDVKATATSGDNTQKQYNENELEAEVENGEGAAVVIGGNSGQYMFTGNSSAGAEQTIVANVNACCPVCGGCDGECGCGERASTINVAFVKDNDVRARAESGDNYQKQKNENELEAEVEGSSNNIPWILENGNGEGEYDSQGSTALVVGGNSEQVLETGDSNAWAAQWIVVNSQGSF